MTDAQLGAYQWALDWMSAIDSYSGLIVSMHRTGLWRGRYGVMKHPVGYSLNVPAVRNPAVDEFVERNEAAQRAQRAAVDDNDVTPRGNGQVQFEPYPFDVRPCRVQLLARRLTQRRFADEEEFRRAV